jgi:hypothetical protein
MHACLQAEVKVPEDALVADFVFLDSNNEQAGFYDNNNGLDYHVPVTGAQGVLPPLRIAHVSVEMAPIAKVGGMGDVVTALGRAVQEYGHEVEVRVTLLVAPCSSGCPVSAPHFLLLTAQIQTIRREHKVCVHVCLCHFQPSSDAGWAVIWRGSSMAYLKLLILPHPPCVLCSTCTSSICACM